MERRSHDSDSKNFAAFIQGDESAFDYFFNQWYRGCCVYASGIVHDDMVAEDIVIDAFVSLWGQREKFVLCAAMKSYLYTIVHNGSLKYLRGRIRADRREQVWQVGLGETEQAPELENLIRAELYAQLENAVKELPAQCSQVFRGLYFEGKTVREVAEELSTTIGNIKSQKNRGLFLLRKFFSTPYILSGPLGIYFSATLFC